MFGFAGFMTAVAFVALPNLNLKPRQLTPGTTQHTLGIDGSVLAVMRNGVAYEVVVQVTSRGLGSTATFKPSDLTVTTADGTPIHGIRFDPIALQPGQTETLRLQFRGPTADALNVKFNLGSDQGIARALNKHTPSFAVPVTVEQPQ